MHSQMKRGFTLIELLVVIAIIAILASLLFPVFARAREKARQTTCLSQQRQIATACLMYVQDNNGKFPGVLWVDNVNEYLNSPKMYVCPSSNDIDGQISYGYNGWLVKFDSFGVSEAMVKVPTEVGLTCDVSPAHASPFGGLVVGGGYVDIQANQNTTAGGAVTPDPRHGKGLICSYTDGHAKYIPGGYDDKDLSNGITRAFFLPGPLGMIDNPAGGIPGPAAVATLPAVQGTTANANLVIGGDSALQPILTAVAEIYRKHNGMTPSWFTRGFYGVNYVTGRPTTGTNPDWLWGDASGSAMVANEITVAYDAMVLIVAKNSKLTTSGTTLFTANAFDFQAQRSDRWGCYVVNTAQVKALFGGETGKTANTFTAYTLRRDKVSRTDFTLTQGGLVYFLKNVLVVSGTDTLPVAGTVGQSTAFTNIGTQAIDCDTELDLVDKVANDPYGIGYCSSAAADPDRVEILAIADSTQTNVLATSSMTATILNDPKFVFPKKNVKYRWKVAATLPNAAVTTGSDAESAWPWYRGLAIGANEANIMTNLCTTSTATMTQLYMGPLFRASFWQP